MTQHAPGRHRRPGRLSTTSTTLTRSAAVAAASTGLLAGVALSAQATPEVSQEPNEGLQRLGIEVSADRTLTVDRPAQAAAAPADISAASFGTSGFTAATPVVEAAPVVEAVPAVAEAPPVDAAPVEEAAAEPVAAPEQATQQVAAREDTGASRSQERTAAPEPAPEPVAAPEPAAPAPTGGVLSVAAAYTGIPYVYGGSTPAGFDCSGYTQFVFAQAGISIPRTTSAQQAAATPVSNPQPGDLVFYGYPAYHVGIYAGDGMMYDSGRPGIPTQLRAVFGGVSGYGRIG
ncbi:C40 family peptidase [Ornithinimicrobium sp. LYQ92]|uniref:C40 family peptidase n=1 Tax=Serinicoccus sp. LYQ92 TaxID=3378798 RepID=UPI003851C430